MRYVIDNLGVLKATVYDDTAVITDSSTTIDPPHPNFLYKFDGVQWVFNNDADAVVRITADITTSGNTYTVNDRTFYRTDTAISLEEDICKQYYT